MDNPWVSTDDPKGGRASDQHLKLFVHIFTFFEEHGKAPGQRGGALGSIPESPGTTFTHLEYSDMWKGMGGFRET